MYAIKLAIKLKIITATTSSCNKTCKTCTTVVQVSQDLFYVLLQLLVVAAAISFKFYCKFYCMFYFTCDRCLKDAWNRIKLHMKRPTIVCDWSSVSLSQTGGHPQQSRWGSLRRSSRSRSRLGTRGTSHPHSPPPDAFDRCSWTFVGTGRGRWTPPIFETWLRPVGFRGRHSERRSYRTACHKRCLLFRFTTLTHTHTHTQTDRQREREREMNK